MLLLAAVPLLWPAIPPFTDLPGHMGSYHLALDLGRSPLLQQHWGFAWHLLGNLGADLLIMPVGSLFGVEAGTKLIAIAIPVLTVAGFLALAREAHGRLPATAAFALPLAYCYPLLLGFLNYCLGAALMLLALALWMKLGREGRIRLRSLIFVALAPMLWVVHAVAWGMLCLAALASEGQRLHAAGRSPSALLPAALSCLPLFAATPLLLTGRNGPTSHIGRMLSPHDIVRGTVGLVHDRWLVPDVAAVAIMLGIAGLAFVRLAGLRLNPRLFWPAAVLIAAFVVLPQQVNGSDYFNSRLAPYGFALAVLAVDTRGQTVGQQRLIAALALAFVLARTAASTASFWLYDQEWRRNLQALNQVRPGTAVAAFARLPCTAGITDWSSPRLYHLPGMALVRRDAFVNSEWQLEGFHLMSVRYPAAAPAEADPSEMVVAEACGAPLYQTIEHALATLPRRAFDYLWLIDIPPAKWPREPGLVPLWRSDHGVLFRIVHPVAGAAR